MKRSAGKSQTKSYLLLFVCLVVLAGIVYFKFIRSEPEGKERDFHTRLNNGNEIGIVGRPFPLGLVRGRLNELPIYDPISDKQWQVDLRGRDPSQLDLTDRLTDLIHADFDSQTRWPEKLPIGFEPDKIMELGKNPGLGIRELHKKGITGKGVGIAIIDQALLVDHVEYRDRLKMYEEIHWAGSTAWMHAPAVASIAVGKTVGVAPDADLFFIAEWHGVEKAEGGFDVDLSLLARSIDRIVEVNALLEKSNRIRVVSISLGVNPKMKGYNKARTSIEKAEKQGIYVVFVGSDGYLGMGRDPLADPEDFNSYSLRTSLKKRVMKYDNAKIMIPMDSRCTASPTGLNDFVFYREGGMSWTVPYVAGLFALACQVNPEVTREMFWDAASKTSVFTRANENGSQTDFGKIINPPALIDALSRKEP